jgi:hypothetical protein
VPHLYRAQRAQLAPLEPVDGEALVLPGRVSLVDIGTMAEWFARALRQSSPSARPEQRADGRLLKIDGQ